jgi:hypothetical protein
VAALYHQRWELGSALDEFNVHQRSASLAAELLASSASHSIAWQNGG